MKTSDEPKKIDTRRLDRLTKRRDDAWARMVKGFEALHAKHPAAAKPLWKTLCGFEDAADAVTRAILNDLFEDKGQLIDRVMLFNAERSREIGGGRKGGLASGKNRIAKRGDCIENHRARWEHLRKTMPARSAATILARKTGFHFDAIARHFRTHPTA